MLEFRLLGPVRGWRDGEELQLGPPQQRTVLAMLLLSDGKPQTPEQIADALWGVDAPSSAVATVRTYIHRLRRVFGDDQQLLVHDNSGYRLDLPLTATDVGKFQELVDRAGVALDDGRADDAVRDLRAAISLCSGAPLAALPGEYVEAERARLRQRRLTVLEDLFRAELDLGRHAEIADQLQVLAAGEPLRESMHELLVLALCRSGRQAEAMLAYDQIRRQLREELGVDPNARLRALYDRMLHGDPEPPVRQALPLVSPAQLPADLPVFAGRSSALAEAHRRLPDGDGAPDRTVVTVIQGMAGIGKTAFALHWAHEVASRFPDGQLYVNLRGYDPVTVDPNDAVRDFLQALGVAAAQVPTEPAARLGLFRSLLAERRCLLLLDNARESAQVLPLLPGRSRSLVIVTSRGRLDGVVAATGARPITLDLLSRDDAVDLLSQRLGAERIAAEPAATDAIVDRCARLPLALSIVCTRILAQSSEFPLADIVASLFGPRFSLDAFAASDPSVDIRAVLRSSYTSLSDGAAQMFRLLALHPGPTVGVHAAASLAAVSVRAAAALLREVADVHLVTETAPGRYGWHDLLRAYATELLETTAEREAAFQRLADHYLLTADCAARKVSAQNDGPPPCDPVEGAVSAELADQEQAVLWYITERQATMRVLELMAAHGLHEHAWRFAWALRQFQDRQQHWYDLIDAHGIALRSATEAGNPIGMAYAHRGLSRAECRLSRLKSAREHMTEALALFEQAGATAALAYALRQYTWVEELDHAPERALEHATRARDLFRAVGWGPGVGVATMTMARYYSMLGRDGEAVPLVYEALMLLPPGDNAELVGAWEVLGEAYYRLGQYEDAIGAHRNAEKVFAALRADADQVSVLLRISTCLLALERRDEAREVLRRAAAIQRTLCPAAMCPTIRVEDWAQLLTVEQ
ncbi:MAG TPA: BTAD domain-containing putative transcriptional regulator [Kutzneria sp.]|nr:BTAD domain-containing putative transcriptional regulator [Kutzneria sp.]